MSVGRFDVFLSHNSRDKPAVERLAEKLKRAGLEPWFDRWCLTPGGQWQDEIAAGLRASAACAVSVGPYGLGDWSREELNVALDRAAKDRAFRLFLILLPGLPEPFESTTLPPFLGTRTWVDLRHGTEDTRAFQTLVNAIKGVPLGASIHDSPPTDRCPYRGLQTFDEPHAEFYFGRDADIQRLIEKLKTTRFLAILGPSGSGKSSLVRAGLIPALRKGALPASESWSVCLFTPGVHPLAALAAQLVHLGPGEAMQKTVDALGADARTLHLAIALAFADSSASKHVVWVIDQFEEMFTLCHDDAQRVQFLANLLYAVSVPGGRAIVLLTMRADFYHKCAAFPDLSALIATHQFLVGSMSSEGLRQAIEEPARRVGLEFEEGLAQTILDEVLHQPGALPLLEHALFELWTRRRARMLTLEAHRESGGVQGAIAKRAEWVYEGLSVDAQSIAQRMMLRLTQPGEGTEDTRRRVPMPELLTRPSESAAVEQVVAKFADARLVTTSAEGKTRSIEVAHEALIRGWPRLRRWIDEDRAGLRLHRRLTESAQEWQRLDRDPGLLYRGGRLAEAIDWRQRYAAVLNDAEREFLDASAALQAKEAGMARRRTRIAVGGLAAAVAILGALAVAAWHERDSALKAKAIALAERDQAEQARKLAQVRQLVAQAQLNQTGSSLLVSTLLAAEAMRRAPSLESDQLVRRGLALLPQPVASMAHDGAVVRVVFSPDGRHLATASRDKTARVWEAVSGRTVTRVTHEGEVNDVVFSTNGLRFATASDDGSARIWETASGREIMRGATGSSVNRVALSPDGRYLAAACSDRTAHVWEIADGREIARLVHYDVVNAVAFSPDGQHVATASGYPSSRLIASAKRDDNVRVWTLQGGREVWRGAHDHNVWAVAFSPDGKYLASASADGTARLWDVNTGRELARLPHEDRVGAIAFSNDSGFLATAVAGFLPIATHDRTARVWEVPSGREVLRVAHESDINAVAFNPDATLLATASQDGTARLWDRTGREILRVASHAGGVSVVGFSPDGSLFATASHDGAVRLWRTFARREFAQITFGGDVNAAIFSPDAKYLVASGTDKTARVLELSTGKEIARLAHGGAVHMLAFGPDSRHMAVAGSDTGEKDFTVRVWDVASKGVVCEVVHDDYVQAIAFSPDGKLLATASKDNNARVWDAVSGQEVLRLPHEKSIFGIVFSRDGRYLATRAEDHSVRLWDLSTGREVAQMRHKNVVAAFAFSPTGELFATASWDRTARIWEVPSGRLIVTIPNERELTAIAFSPDGQSVATADGGTTRILEAASGRELARLADSGASTLAFSPDGRHIATGGFRRMVRVWEVTTGRTVAGIIHESSVQRIAFDPEGRYLLTTSGDILSSRGHVARVSAWRPADLIAEVCGRLTRNLSIAEWRQHLEAEPYQATCPDIPGHAIDMLKQADDHAASGQRDLAEAGFTEAVRAALRQEDAEIDNAACWFGSIDGFAKIILPACQQAVALANDNMSPQYRDSRGLARALTGDRDGAIEDFKAFAAWAKTSDGNAQSALQREAWMATIQSGGNPFDAETLKALRKQ